MSEFDAIDDALNVESSIVNQKNQVLLRDQRKALI